MWTTKPDCTPDKQATWLARLAATFLMLLFATPASHAAAPPAPLSGRQVSGFAELLLPTAATTPDEDVALATALDSYERANNPESVTPLEEFLAAHPHSPWRVALLTNLGLAYYHHGYFSRAIDAWEQAWAQGRSVTDPAVRPLIDRAVGELIRFYFECSNAQLTALPCCCGLLRTARAMPWRRVNRRALSCCSRQGGAGPTGPPESGQAAAANAGVRPLAPARLRAADQVAA